MSYWAIGVACLTSYKVEGRGSKTAIIEPGILFLSPPKSIYWFVILVLPPSFLIIANLLMNCTLGFVIINGL